MVIRLHDLEYTLHVTKQLTTHASVAVLELRPRPLFWVHGLQLVHVILGVGACCARIFLSVLGVLASRAL